MIYDACVPLGGGRTQSRSADDPRPRLPVGAPDGIARTFVRKKASRAQLLYSRKFLLFEENSATVAWGDL